MGVEDHDVVQEAFAEIVRKGLIDAPSLQARASVVAYRRAVDRLRAHQRSPECPWPEATAALGAELGADDEVLLDEELRRREEVLAQALICLDRLPGRLADTVRQNIMQGTSLAQIARNEGVSHEAARKWRNKGLELLVECLGQTLPQWSGRRDDS
ncbi:MAG: RNA polymerase sigma factor [Acidimicrobiales bacterium]